MRILEFDKTNVFFRKRSTNHLKKRGCAIEKANESVSSLLFLGCMEELTDPSGGLPARFLRVRLYGKGHNEKGSRASGACASA